MSLDAQLLTCVGRKGLVQALTTAWSRQRLGHEDMKSAGPRRDGTRETDGERGFGCACSTKQELPRD